MTSTTWAIEMFRQGHSVEEVTSKMKEAQVKFPSFGDAFLELLQKKEKASSKTISEDSIAIEAEISGSTLNRYKNNALNPGRNATIRIAIALGADIYETQVLLKSANCAKLSGERPRDLIIMNGIINQTPIEDINTQLEANKFKDLMYKA